MTARREETEQRSYRAALIGSINVVAAILAARLILMLSVIGAIFLAWLALLGHDPVRVAVLALYTATVVIPLVWLCSRRA